MRWILVLVTVAVSSRITARKESGKEIFNVTAIVGRQAGLPCNLMPPSHDDEVYLVLWYKDESAIPIYSIDARAAGLNTAKHVASDSLATRSYFNTIHKPATLFLERVAVYDDGHYRCRVDFRLAKTRNSVIRLHVIVPPKEPVIKNQFNQVVSGIIGPYTEGQRLLLICETEGGLPAPSLTWWSGAALIDDTYEFLGNGVVRNQLQIISLQREHAMMVLVCQASNNHQSPPTSARITLNLYLRPKTVKIISQHNVVNSDLPTQFVCRAIGSQPPANITWWKGNAKLSSLQYESFEEGNVTTSVLTMHPHAEDNEQEMACSAENSLVPGSAIEDVIKLEVYFPPQVKLRLGSNLRFSSIQENHDVYYECEIRANPWVTEVGWHFEGRELQTNTTAGVIVMNQTLVLQKIRRNGRGRYTCSALNERGRSESNPVYLRVQYAPLCRERQKILYGVTKHKVTKVSCEVDADPSEVSFRWTFNNSREDIDIISFVNDGMTSVASYVPRSDLDYGTLMCWGINKVGMQREPCLFFVVPAGPPDAPQNCSLTNQTGRSFIIACNPGDNNGLLQTYHLEVQDDVLQKIVANHSGDFPFFAVTDLPTGRTFTLVIYSSNDLGKSSSLVFSGVTLATSDRLTHRGNFGTGGHFVPRCWRGVSVLSTYGRTLKMAMHIEELRQPGDTKWEQRISPTVVTLICSMVVLLALAVTVIVVLRIRKAKTKEKENLHLKSNNRIPVCSIDGAEDIVDMSTIIENHKPPDKGKDWASPGKLSNNSGFSCTPLLDGHSSFGSFQPNNHESGPCIKTSSNNSEYSTTALLKPENHVAEEVEFKQTTL